MKPLVTVRYGEPFLFLCEIKNESPYSLKFNNSLLNTVIKYKYRVLEPNLVF